MSRQTLPDHLAVEHIEGGEQRRCAMSFEVVGHGAGTTLFQGQSRLAAV